MCIPNNGGHPFLPNQEHAPFQQTVPRWVSLLNDAALHQMATLCGRLTVTWPLHHISDIVLYYKMILIPCQVPSRNFAVSFITSCIISYTFSPQYTHWMIKYLDSIRLLHYNNLKIFHNDLLRWRRKVNPYRFTRESMPWLKACFESNVLKFPPELLYWMPK